MKNSKHKIKIELDKDFITVLYFVILKKTRL